MENNIIYKYNSKEIRVDLPFDAVLNFKNGKIEMTENRIIIKTANSNVILLYEKVKEFIDNSKSYLIIFKYYDSLFSLVFLK